MNLLNRILRRQPKLTKEQVLLLGMAEGLQTLESHMIALARINFIKAETLIREADNTEENLNYLKKLIELRDKHE